MFCRYLVLGLFSISLHAYAQDETAARRNTAVRLLELGSESYRIQQYTEAMKYFEMSMAIAPTDIAATNLCNIFLYGLEVEKDYERAEQLCVVAIEFGNASAMVMYGEMHLSGLGVPKDIDRAMALFRQAAEKGHSHGQFLLASMLESSDSGEAQYWLNEAAGNGHKAAQEVMKHRGR
jgi:TPR repeat protein